MFNVPAVKGQLEPVKIYPVTEEELHLLEKGSNASLFLNFAIALLSIASSAMIAWLTVENMSPTITAVISSITFSGYAIGFLLLGLWWKSGSGQKEVLQKIRARIQEEQMAEAAVAKLSEVVREPVELPRGEV